MKNSIRNPESTINNIKASYKLYYKTAFHLNARHENVQKKKLELFEEKNLVVTRPPEIELIPEYQKTDIRFDEQPENGNSRQLNHSDLLDDAGNQILNDEQLKISQNFWNWFGKRL